MPKLIVKQDVETTSWQEKLAGQFKYILPVVLLLVAGLLFFVMKPASDELDLTAASNPDAQAEYRTQHADLTRMDSAYAALADTEAENYQKNLKLVGQIEGILSQLDAMDGTADLLGLPKDQQGVLLKKHQYQKDYWQAKLHFRQLRLNRYSSDNPSVTQDALRDAVGKAIDARNIPPPVEEAPSSLTENKPEAAAPETGDTAVMTKPPAGGSRFLAKPPPGADLPAGFCSFGDDSCKVGAGDVPAEGNVAIDDDSNAGVSDDDMTMMKPPAGGSRFLAKPPPGADLPAGFCSFGDDSCKVGAGDVPAEGNVAIDEDSNAGVSDDDMTMMKPPVGGSRFLAKPPPGADLPAGFCSFGDDSCKPGAAGTQDQSGDTEKK